MKSVLTCTCVMAMHLGLSGMFCMLITILQLLPAGIYLIVAHEELHTARAVREDRHGHCHLFLSVILAKDETSQSHESRFAIPSCILAFASFLTDSAAAAEGASFLSVTHSGFCDHKLIVPASAGTVLIWSDQLFCYVAS